MISVVGALAEGTGNKAEAVAPGSSGWSGVLSTGTLNTKHLHSFFLALALSALLSLTAQARRRRKR